MKKITCLLMNYKRPENLPRVVQSIRDQSIDSDIILWDNSNKYSGDVNMVIKSSINLLCQPRIIMCGFVKTKYIWTQDDDRFIRDQDLFKKLIDISEEYEDKFMICTYGKNFRDIPEHFKDTPYMIPRGETVPGFVFDYNIEVQFGATGFMFMPTKLINLLPNNPFINDQEQLNEEEFKYGDDMWISKFIPSRVATCIAQGTKAIPDGGQGLCHQENHYHIRNKLCKKYWPERNK